MRLLLDTHALLWAAADSPRLSARARAVIEDAGNELLVSSVVAAEIAFKAARGHLDLPGEPGDWVRTRLLAFGARELPLTVSHALAAGSLRRHHADPWDRLLIGQAVVERLPILTADPTFASYGVEAIW